MCDCSGKRAEDCTCKKKLIWAGKEAIFKYQDKVLKGIVADIYYDDITIGYLKNQKVEVVIVKKEDILNSNYNSLPHQWLINFYNSINYWIYERDSREKNMLIVFRAIEKARRKTNEEIEILNQQRKKEMKAA